MFYLKTRSCFILGSGLNSKHTKGYYIQRNGHMDDGVTSSVRFGFRAKVILPLPGFCLYYFLFNVANLEICHFYFFSGKSVLVVTDKQTV